MSKKEIKRLVIPDFESSVFDFRTRRNKFWRSMAIG